MATGDAVIVIVDVAITVAHPADETVLVTVYVPLLLDEIVTTPVDGLIDNPAGDEVNVPATPIRARR